MRRTLPKKTCGRKPVKINVTRYVRAQLDAALTLWELRNGYIPQSSAWDKREARENGLAK